MNAMNKNTDKTLVRAGIVAVLILSLLVVSTAVILISRHLEEKENLKKIYGVWDEQDVPAYSRDVFEVRKDGVYIDDRVVDTHFHFDGKTLTYKYDNKKYIYQIKNVSMTELERIAPLHYKSVFFLRGKHKNKP